MDYKYCKFPKPDSKKKKKKVNGYKDKKNRYCYYCGKANAERHEIFAGANRQNSIDYQFQIDLCPAHHKELQDGVTQWAIEENLFHKRKAQATYLIEIQADGVSKEKALAMWMNLIGKNYLEECDPE